MSELKRYFSEECRSTDGLFVLDEDYARLEQECERLRAALNAIAVCTPDDKARDCALAALGENK